MSENSFNPNSPESKGWELVRLLNESVGNVDSITARKQLAEFFKLQTTHPSKLHSAILSVAVKMAIMYPDFHFVPFLDFWGLENLRPEDAEAKVDESGKRFPSLVERMAKAYAYSLLFHADERLDGELEEVLKPYLESKGYCLEQPTMPMIATVVRTVEVKSRKMTFVQLISPEGEEVSAEVHTITAYNHMRYDDIQNKLFRVLLRRRDVDEENSDAKSDMRIEAAILSKESLSEAFPSSVGYVEHLDVRNHHIHVFENQSRHFVATMSAQNAQIKEGDYVLFTTIIPQKSKFKSAIINKIYSGEEGPAAFGYRKAKITYVDQSQGYCAWELLEGELPIVEMGTKEPSFTKGYLSKQLFESLGKTMPEPQTEIRVIVFLKRGKDGNKRPFVVHWQ